MKKWLILLALVPMVSVGCMHVDDDDDGDDRTSAVYRRTETRDATVKSDTMAPIDSSTSTSRSREERVTIQESR